MTNVLSSIRGAVANQVGILGGTTTYDVIGDLPLSGNEAGDQAFVIATNRLYLWSGAGWYNIAIINTTPTFSTGPDASYTLASDGVTTTVISLLATDPEGFAITYSAVADSDFNGLATVSQDSSVFTITPKSEANATTSTGTLTFKATDGVNIASEISTFTLTFSPDWTTTPTESKIQASAVDLAGFTFGKSVSINSDATYALVGAIGADDFGAAYIFERSGSTWSQTAKLAQLDGEADDNFGISVSISSDGAHAIVGAYFEDGGVASPLSNAGAAYYFTRSGSSWTQQQKIVSSDLQLGDEFGHSVSISSDGNYAIVGARREDTGGSSAGSAYIFTRSGSTWTQQAKIQSSEVQANDFLSESLSINSDGTYVILGAPNEDGGAGNPIANAGAAYVFTRSGSTWTEQAILRASDPSAQNYFGQSVSINPDATYAVVGSSGVGAAYVFTRSGSTWTQQAKIVSSDLQAGDQYGISVSINSNGTYVIVGANYEDGGAGDPATNAGAAYIYERDGSTWTQIRKLTASDTAANDHFGTSVSTSSNGSYVIVGASGSDTQATNAGAAYIYKAG